MKNILIIITTLLIFVSAITGCGSAEAVEQFNYATTKAKVENAVLQVLATHDHPNITWDTTELIVKRYRTDDMKNAPMDTIRMSKSDHSFFWITIKNGDIETNYELMYLGDKHSWKTSPTSAICLDHVWNNAGLDIRQGENVGDFSSEEAKKAKRIFEKEFLSRLDKELNITHTTGRSVFQ